MAEPSRATALPPTLHHYFREYDPGRLRVVEDRPTIMLRLMESGEQDAIRWLRSTYGDGPLHEFVAARQGRGLSPKRLRYWELLLGLPGDDVSRWVASARAGTWYGRIQR